MTALPITSLYAGLCSLLLLWLSYAVVSERRNSKVGLGDGGIPAMQRAIRIHANFIEYVPFTLILLALAEAAAVMPWLLHLCGSLLLIARVAHARGLAKTAGVSQGRFYGTAATWVVILVLGIVNLATAVQSL